MKTLLKIVAVVMVIFTSSIAFVDEYSDSDDDFNDDVFSATDAMKAYNKNTFQSLVESLCSGAEFYSLSQDTIKFKARKIKCDSTGCIIQLKEKFKEKIIGPPLRPPRDHPDWQPSSPPTILVLLSATAIICPDDVSKFDINSLKDEIIGKKVKIKGMARKSDSFSHRHTIILVNSPEDIEVVD